MCKAHIYTQCMHVHSYKGKHEHKTYVRTYGTYTLYVHTGVYAHTVSSTHMHMCMYVVHTYMHIHMTYAGQAALLTLKFKATVPVCMCIHFSVPTLRDSAMEILSLATCLSELSSNDTKPADDDVAVAVVRCSLGEGDGCDSKDGDGEGDGGSSGAHKCKTKFSGHFYSICRTEKGRQVHR